MEFLNKKENLTWATWVGLIPGILAVPGLVYAVLDSLANQPWQNTVFLLLPFLAVFISGIVIWRKTRPSQHKAFSTKYFQPFVKKKDLHSWPRPEIQNELESRYKDMLTKKSSKIIVLSGDSGTGKTVILNNFVKELDMIKHKYYDLYSPDFGKRLCEEINRENYEVVVLDQFEQFLAYLSSLTRAHRLIGQEELLRAISAHQKTVFVFAIRSEWVYEMRFLGKSSPKLNTIIDVGPLVNNVSNHALEEIKHQLACITQSETVAEELLGVITAGNNTLPVEVQIVGSVIESTNERGKQISLDWFTAELGGIRGAVNSYLNEILRCAPDRRIAAKVLCALSVQTKFRQQQSLPHILDALFEDEDKVKASLSYLEDQNLVQVGNGKTYQLVHDYLAYEFDRITTAELDLDERENTRFHIENKDGAQGIVLSRDERENNKSAHRVRTIVPILGLLMTARLFLPCFFQNFSRSGALLIRFYLISLTGTTSLSFLRI